MRANGAPLECSLRHNALCARNSILYVCVQHELMLNSEFLPRQPVCTSTHTGNQFCAETRNVYRFFLSFSERIKHVLTLYHLCLLRYDFLARRCLLLQRNAVWNETFEFEVTHTLCSLYIQVRDWDKASNSDRIGAVEIPLAEVPLCSSLYPAPPGCALENVCLSLTCH